MKLSLKAVNETWNVIFKPSFTNKTTVQILDQNEIIITSRRRDRKYALHKWLQFKGRNHLIPWLDNLSTKTALLYNKVSIRGQRTRWGSCSEHKNINLNYQLLFLESELVDYIITHELCHTKYLNHSKEFWQLVAKYHPNHHELRKQLRNYHGN
jgi:predicted metal-dependent hydrolase